MLYIWTTAASNSTELEKLWKITRFQLKEILKQHNEPTSDNKSYSLPIVSHFMTDQKSNPCTNVLVSMPAPPLLPVLTDVQCDPLWPLAELNRKENVTYIVK